MSNEAITWAYRQDLSAGPKFVLLVLADMADEAATCYPGQDRIAKMTGQSVRSVRRHLEHLEESGLIVRKHRYDQSGNRTSDRYELPVDGDVLPVKMTTGQNDRRSDSSPLPAKNVATTGQGDRVTQREPKDEPSDSRAAFDEFWLVYPRHVGKPKAQAAFAKAAKRTDAEKIIAGARRYRGDPNRQDAFTAHPATWLNRDGWDDDPLPGRERGAPRLELVPDW